MLEDPNKMDHKKNPRATSSGQTSNNSDQRINTKQDATVGNFKSTRPPRFTDSGSRRRSGGQDYSLSAEPRGPPRKGQVKRPPPRGQNPKSTYPDDNSNDTMTQADEFEVGSLFNYGSKKQSLNHLLNFQFEPRNFVGQRNRGSTGPISRKRNDPLKRRPKYSKEQYLQANCQFIVREGNDYNIHLHDADNLVDWNLIEQVNLKTTADVPSCPICLYPPTAAKITRCGHVFCWSCILHYLALSDHSWRKCPICDEAIHRQDLKSVVSVAWKEFNVGEEIEMYLMRRERNSLFALPVDFYFPEVNLKHPNIADRSNYSHLVTATPAQVAKHIIAREKYELENQYRAEKNEPEACFIEEALQYVSERENGIVLNSSQHNIKAESFEEEIVENDEASPEDPESSDGLDFFVEDEEENVEPSDESSRPRHTSSSSDGTNTENIDSPSEVTAEDLDISNVQSAQCNNEDSKNSPKSTFYFYQSSDGQPIFLHAINIQMLVKQFGSFENCPKVIRGNIVEKDGASMTSELRNKLRYLKHMPVTSTFEVCELEMKFPTFSKEIIQEFLPQLDTRRRRRQRRAREEKRRDKQISIELDKTVLGKFPGAKLRIESSFHFPEVGSGQLGLARSTESLVSVDSTLSTSPTAWGSQASGGGSSSVSFAKMLREGIARPTRMISVRPSEAQFTPSQQRPRHISGEESEPEDYIPPPPKANIGDVLAQALEMSTIQESSAPSQKKKGKKLKGKSISLTGGGGRMSLN